MPQDGTLLPNGSLRLNCSSNVAGTPVVWSFTAEDSVDKQAMTSHGVLTAKFREKFMIDSSKNYDLIATKTDNTEPYCGTYECVDANGAGETATATVASRYTTESILPVE